MWHPVNGWENLLGHPYCILYVDVKHCVRISIWHPVNGWETLYYDIHMTSREWMRNTVLEHPYGILWLDGKHCGCTSM